MNALRGPERSPQPPSNEELDSALRRLAGSIQPPAEFSARLARELAEEQKARRSYRRSRRVAWSERLAGWFRPFLRPRLPAWLRGNVLLPQAALVVALVALIFLAGRLIPRQAGLTSVAQPQSPNQASQALATGNASTPAMGAALPEATVAASQPTRLAMQALDGALPALVTPEQLADMDVTVTFSTSPDGRFELEALRAVPSAGSGVVEQAYNRLTVTDRLTTQPIWRAIDELVPTGPGAESPAAFTWEPDGSAVYIAYHSTPDGCAAFPAQVRLLKADLEARQVTTLLDGGVRAFDLSPQAASLAYLPVDFAAGPRLIVRDMASGRESTVPVDSPAPLPDAGLNWQAGGLKWSPDGERLVFSFVNGGCGEPGGKLNQVMLVEPATGQVTVVSGPDQNLSFVRWEPDGRLRVIDSENNPIALDPDTLRGRLLAAESSGPNRLTEAQNALVTFFGKLASPFGLEADFFAASEMYTGSYAELARLNNDLVPQDKMGILAANFTQQEKAALLQRACLQNEYHCLRVRRVVSAQAVENPGQPPVRFYFEVEFLNRDGSLFELNGVSQFAYEVVLTPEGDYLVDGLPPR